MITSLRKASVPPSFRRRTGGCSETVHFRVRCPEVPDQELPRPSAFTAFLVPRRKLQFINRERISTYEKENRHNRRSGFRPSGHRLYRSQFLQYRTVDADSLQVLSRKTEDGVLSMDIGIGTSSHVLTGYRFSRETDAIRVTVKKAPVWSLFSLSPRGLPLKSLSSPAWSFPSILRTGEKQVAAQLPDESREP